MAKRRTLLIQIYQTGCFLRYIIYNTGQLIGFISLNKVIIIIIIIIMLLNGEWGMENEIFDVH